MNIEILCSTCDDEQLLTVIRAALSVKAFLSGYLRVGENVYEIESHRVGGKLEITAMVEEWGDMKDLIVGSIPL